MKRKLYELASAKINLTLKIKGRRDDGFHKVSSLVAFTEVGDVVCGSCAKDMSLDITGPFAPHVSSGTNLVVRAAQTFFQEMSLQPCTQFMLEKNLPVASGIGGGSADAAATLRLLARLHRENIKSEEDIEPERLQRLACVLGADVPVCLGGQPAMVSGIGEQVEPLESFPTVSVVLINLGVGVSTAKVFRAFAEKAVVSDTSACNLPVFRDAYDIADWCRDQGNDLTVAACGIAPEIADVLYRLENIPLCLLARMSGSGDTCFALFAEHEEAQSAAQRTKNETGWWVCASRLRGV
ncbi:MAG: 4-(cytidine 5'-diphospho)-2-C-methyl-D-erythritol kinase [Parvularculales bacterium]